MNICEITNEYAFYAETIEVKSFKILINFIRKNFKENFALFFKVNKNGIFIRVVNTFSCVNFSLLLKNLEKFVYNLEDELEFYITIDSLISIEKELDFSRKKNLLCIALKMEKNYYDDNYYLCFETTTNYHIIDKESKYYPKFFIKIFIEDFFPENVEGIFPLHPTRCINVGKLKLKWRDNSYDKPNFVKIKLSKTRVEFEYRYTEWTRIILGEYSPEILYERTFLAKKIKDILKSSSLGTLRIYHSKDHRNLLFSTTIENGLGYINIYAIPIETIEENKKMNENNKISSPRIIRSYKDYF